MKVSIVLAIIVVMCSGVALGIDLCNFHKITFPSGPSVLTVNVGASCAKDSGKISWNYYIFNPSNKLVVKAERSNIRLCLNQITLMSETCVNSVNGVASITYQSNMTGIYRGRFSNRLQERFTWNITSTA